jgi:hypothetical protein
LLIFSRSAARSAPLTAHLLSRIKVKRVIIIPWCQQWLQWVGRLILEPLYNLYRQRKMHSPPHSRFSFLFPGWGVKGAILNFRLDDIINRTKKTSRKRMSVSKRNFHTQTGVPWDVRDIFIEAWVAQRTKFGQCVLVSPCQDKSGWSCYHRVKSSRLTLNFAQNLKLNLSTQESLFSVQLCTNLKLKRWFFLGPRKIGERLGHISLSTNLKLKRWFFLGPRKIGERLGHISLRVLLPLSSSLWKWRS